MPLTGADWKKILGGFLEAPLVVVGRPKLQSPTLVSWTVGDETLKYRLWGFEVTHGGGNRDDEEFRIQVSNGPTAAMGVDGYADLLIGYVRTEDVIVVYSTAYLEHFLQRYLATGNMTSPSVQVKRAELLRGAASRFHSFAKPTKIAPNQVIAVFKPDFLPAFLLDPSRLIGGSISPEEVLQNMPGTPSDLWSFCESRGFHFPPSVLARYLAALSAKPFVILAGTTGTGKTKMAQLVAEFFCSDAGDVAVEEAPDLDDAPEGAELEVEVAPAATVDRTRIAFVPVRPDWTDNQALLGYYNPILQRYEPTAALLLILRAMAAERAAREAGADSPKYFLILDEMNLARVEHYFSDFLSVLETRKPGAGGSIEAEAIPLHSVANLQLAVEAAGGSEETVEIPQKLEIPTNLLVVGTVNVDETTFGFSPKVLDRAMVIEFHDVDLDRLRGTEEGEETEEPEEESDAVGEQEAEEESEEEQDAEEQEVEEGHEGALEQDEIELFSVLPPFTLASEAQYRRAPAVVHRWMKVLNRILQPTRLHAGYRSACEIASFVQYFSEQHEAIESTVATRMAMDAAILQKILPRLHGNRARLGDSLTALHHFLRTGEAANALKPEDELALIAKDHPEAAFPLSRARLAEMLEVLTQFGFVSFFR